MVTDYALSGGSGGATNLTATLNDGRVTALAEP